ncbi:MAG: hypothetical protein V8S99_08050 [Oscillospiraceae bacterium]
MMRWKELLEKKPHAWVKWGVITACLCIVIAVFFVIRQRAAALPVEQVENAVFVSREEEPVMQRDDLKNMLVNNIVVWGTVQDCSYLRIPAGDSVWYLTTMRVAVDTVIRGETDAPTIDIVSGECYTGEVLAPKKNSPSGPVSRTAFRGRKGILAVSPVQAGAVWDIGGRSTAVREFGDYIYRHPLQPAGGRHRL